MGKNGRWTFFLLEQKFRRKLRLKKVRSVLKKDKLLLLTKSCDKVLTQNQSGTKNCEPEIR